MDLDATDSARRGQEFLRGPSATLMVEHNDPSLIDGFHRAEATHRWTDGNARIPPAFLGCFAQNLTIEVRLRGQGLPYRIGRWASAVPAESVEGNALEADTENAVATQIAG
jgi:hypothetical protein